VDERPKVTEQNVRDIAALAGLPLAEDRIPVITTELRGMMALVEKIHELDTTELEPDLPFDARWD
jgi:Asp-tRNA(Asn)/Glu-tRNA(Gln) amidotransferase C subunit